MTQQRKRTRRPAPSPTEPGVGAPETYTVMDPAGNDVQVPTPQLEAAVDGTPVVRVPVEAMRAGADPLILEQAKAELDAFGTADVDWREGVLQSERDAHPLLEVLVPAESVDDVAPETSDQRRRRQRYERMAAAHQARVGTPRTYVVGARPLKVGGALRQPGAEVPEALTWPRVETWVNTGKIVPVPA